MKKLVIATTIAALLSGSVMSAAMADPRDDHQRYQQQQQQQNNRFDNRHDNNRHDNDRDRHHWKQGQRVSKEYRDRRYVVNDYRNHQLRKPPRGYQWVHDDQNNFLMVAVATGVIASIIAASNH